MDELKQMVKDLSAAQRRDLLNILLRAISDEHHKHNVRDAADPVEVGSAYVRRMNEILGINILETDRHRDFLWGRNIVIWQMGLDGFTEKQICEVIPLTHSTICNSRARMRGAFQVPGSNPFAISLYNKFTSLI